MCSITRLTHRWFWFTSQVSRVPPHPANPAQQSGLSNPHQSSLVDSGSLSLLLSALQPVLQYVPFSCLYRFVPAVLPSILYCHCQSCRSKGLFYSILFYYSVSLLLILVYHLHDSFEYFGSNIYLVKFDPRILSFSILGRCLWAKTVRWMWNSIQFYLHVAKSQQLISSKLLRARSAVYL